jgi:hypothetical protein
MKLGGADLKSLQEALLAAFPTRNKLASIVRLGLGENLEEIASASADLRDTVFKLIEWTESHGRLEELVKSARPELPNAGAPIPFHVPFPRNENFVGREDDLERLHRMLQEQRTVGVRPAMLSGLGGIGKTQLAAEYAHARRASYPGGVYWVNAAAEEWGATIARLAVEMGLEASEGPEAERQIQLIARFKAHLHARPDALLVFDNVSNPADLHADHGGGLVPANLGCRVLFTTRRRDVGGRFGSIEVSVLPEDAALELLLSSLARRPLWEGRVSAEAAEEIREARAICRALGGLPLALVLASAFLGKNRKVSLSGYRRRIADKG